MSNVCPHLRQDDEGRFRCVVLGSIVDPIALPCLSRYWECPYYLQAAREEELKAEEAKPVTEVVEEKEVSEEAEEVSVVEAAEALPRPIPEIPLKEELKESIENSLRSFKLLDEHWRRYESEAKRTLEEWAEVKEELIGYSRLLNNLVETIKNEIHEIEAKRELGFLDVEEANKLISSLREKMEKYSAELSEVNSLYKQLEAKAKDHRKRIIAAVPLVRNRLRLSLMKLENLFKEGKISKEMYEKLKKELEEALGEGVAQ